ncbi:unnamed protein product [Rhodiola kirilowii]
MLQNALKFQGSLLDFFWGDCVLTATYLINRLPSGLLKGKTPYQILFDSAPSYEHLRVFGCLCFTTTISSGKRKFDSRADACIFVGYPHGQKVYKLFNLKPHAYLVSRDVIFQENRFPFNNNFETLPVMAAIPLPHCTTSDILFDPILVHTPAVVPEVTISEDDEHSTTNNAPNDPVPIINDNPTDTTQLSDSTALGETSTTLRRSTRVLKLSVLLKDFDCSTSTTKYPISNFVQYSHCSQHHQKYVLQTSAIVEPTSYTQTSKDPKWVTAMETEIQALQSNNTWQVIHLPFGKNAISSKWIFRVKKHSGDTIERYKARLVARGFSQEEGLDYNESFTPVVKRTTVCTVIALASSKNWPLLQLDVDNAFLHGALDEEVYMSFPPGFFKQEKQMGMVYKLNKSLYGLKQAPRQI